MPNNTYFIVSASGELFSVEGESEKDARDTKRFYEQEQRVRGLQVVRRDRLSPANLAAVVEYEEKVKREVERMMGRRVA